MAPLYFLVIIVVIFMVALTALAWRKPKEQVPPAGPALAIEDPAERAARRRALEPTENELLARRVELDNARNTLGGNSAIDRAFDELQARLRAGEIDEAEFEREKIKLFGG